MLLTFFTGCQHEELDTVHAEASPIESSRESMAIEMVNLLKNEKSKEFVLSQLIEKEHPIKIQDLLQTETLKDKGNSLQKSISNYTSSSNKADVVPEIPEIRLYKPNTQFSLSDVLISFVPDEGSEDDWVSIKAFDSSGNIVMLDAHVEPNRPVIIIDTKGREHFLAGIEFLNASLKERKLQERKSQAKISNNQGKSTDLETSMLTKVKFRDVKEPWISGDAEIYAIASGIRNSQNEAEVNIIPMPYINKSHSTYYPNQIVLFWDDYAYQAADLQFFEKDDNYNWGDLLIVISDAISSAGILSSEPYLLALNKISNAILEAVPDSWTTNDDDYVDSYYTIRKGWRYWDWNGASNNGKLDIYPYILPAN